MNFKALLNNKIVICFHEEKNIFLNLKKNDPFLNFKIMEIKEVYERLTFIHDYKAIAEIILNKKVSLKAARQILNCIRFVDEKAELATMTNGEVMFVRGRARIVTMIAGNITGIYNNANLVSMLDGEIKYLLNDCRIGTMNNGTIRLFADNSEVSTFNNGRIDEMVGKALISANMNGEIGLQEKQTIILYSPQESSKRMSEYLLEKEDESQKTEEQTAQLVQKEDVQEEKQEEVEVKLKRKTKTKQLKLDLDENK